MMAGMNAVFIIIEARKVICRNGVSSFSFWDTMYIGIFILILLFNLLLFLLPLIALLIIVSYLFRMLNKLKKEEPNNYIDVKYKVKK